MASSATRPLSAMPATVRVGDQDRAEAASRLAVHAAAGRLTVTELEERLDRVHAAVVARDLQVIEADLPAATSPRAVPRRLPLVAIAIAIVVAAASASVLVGHPVVPLFVVGALVWRAHLRGLSGRPMLARDSW